MNKELEEQFAETKRAVEAVVGRWGPFPDDLTSPGAIAIFQERGITIDTTFQRLISHKNGDSRELDILGVNGEW